MPRDVPAAEREAAFLKFANAVQTAALAALRTSGERARAVLDALGSGDGELAPFVARGATGPAITQARSVLAALEPSIVPLARHPDADMRTKALVLASRFTSDAAVGAVVAGLEDASEPVQRVALSAIAGERADGRRVPATPQAVQAVGKVLAAHDSWALRVLAARAMGRLGAAGGGADASKRLEEAATKDSYALVEAGGPRGDGVVRRGASPRAGFADGRERSRAAGARRGEGDRVADGNALDWGA